MHEHLDHLLRCIREDPDNEHEPTRYEAAHALEACFDNLAERGHSDELLTGIATAVTELFLASDEAVQRALETGFLEHVLEQSKLRHFFAAWEGDSRLHDSWRNALAWGEAHENFTKNLRKGSQPQDC